jgi:hypothetical protein
VAEEAEEVEEAKEVEDDGLRKLHRERTALRAVVLMSELKSSGPLKNPF